MAKTFRVTVTKLEEPLFDGEAVFVIVPGVEGEMTVLPEHEALITPLSEGTIRVQKEDHEEIFNIERGVLEISNNQATILV